MKKRKGDIGPISTTQAIVLSLIIATVLASFIIPLILGAVDAAGCSGNLQGIMSMLADATQSEVPC